MKKIFVFTGLIFLVLTLGLLFDTYGLLESAGRGETEFEIGRWNISINELDVTLNHTITAENLVYFGNDKVEPGYFAPGTSAGFEMVIDAHDTDVSVRYDITIDISQLDQHQNIELYVVGDAVRRVTEEGIVYTGIIPLSDIQQGIKKTIYTGLIWIHDEDFNELDTLLIESGLQIRISITFTQYLGETI